MTNKHKHQLFEGLEAGDLARLVHNEIHVDEFKSKMGVDEDICVISFKVDSKEPGYDLVNFIEKGYDFVLDADLSAGQFDNGCYLVFVELERSSKTPEQIIRLLSDLANVTKIDANDWRFVYQEDGKEMPVTLDNLQSQIPFSSRDYRRKFGDEDKLDAMKESAGIKFTHKAPVNEWTNYLKTVARIKQ